MCIFFKSFLDYQVPSFYYYYNNQIANGFIERIFTSEKPIIWHRVQSPVVTTDHGRVVLFLLFTNKNLIDLMREVWSHRRSAQRFLVRQREREKNDLEAQSPSGV